MFITTAAEALAVTIEAGKPKPTADEVCERIEAYARNGKRSVVYPAKLPIETVDTLRARGFEVRTGSVGTVIDWREGRDAVPQATSG